MSYTAKHIALIDEIKNRDKCIILHHENSLTLRSDITFKCYCGSENTKNLWMLRDVGAFCKKCTWGKMEEKRKLTRQKNKELRISESKRTIQTNDDMENFQVVVLKELNKKDFSFMCIYGWLNTHDNKWYVGQCLCFNERVKEHISRSHNSDLHKDLSSNPQQFKLYILARPPTLNDIEELQRWLNETEKHYIEKLEAFTYGYNKTMGGLLNQTDISNHKRMKQSLLEFDKHIKGCEWYFKNIGQVGLIHRDYVIPETIEFIGEMPLGYIVHKWRNNPNAFYFQIKGNLDRLYSYGYTTTHQEAKFNTVIDKDKNEENVWYSSFKNKWLVGCDWYYNIFGHVNIPTTFVVPDNDSVPNNIRKMKLGCWIIKVREGRALKKNTEIVIRKHLMRMLLMDTESWRSFLIIQALFYYIKDFAIFNYIPQSFTFPNDYRIKYLRSYGLHNIHNLLKRKNQLGSAESERYLQIKRKLNILYMYLYLKTNGKPYNHKEHLHNNPDVSQKMK
jgi:hypothetical protein